MTRGHPHQLCLGVNAETIRIRDYSANLPEADLWRMGSLTRVFQGQLLRVLWIVMKSCLDICLGGQ